MNGINGRYKGRGRQRLDYVWSLNQRAINKTMGDNSTHAVGNNENQQEISLVFVSRIALYNDEDGDVSLRGIRVY